MKLQIIVAGLFFMSSVMITHPMIRTINNNSSILYEVTGHNDLSGCSDFHAGKKVQVKPYSKYENPFLLGFEKPGLILRPIAYYDKKAQLYYSFLDDASGEYDRKKFEIAFDAWKKNNSRKYKKGFDVWCKEWLCGDISLIHNHVEIFGYFLNTALTRIENDKNFHVCMIDYSQGVFSRLFIDITIEQKKNLGITPYVKSFVGQGGLCQDGQVIVLH